jgi:hypothetical protein
MASRWPTVPSVVWLDCPIWTGNYVLLRKFRADNFSCIHDFQPQLKPLTFIRSSGWLQGLSTFETCVCICTNVSRKPMDDVGLYCTVLYSASWIRYRELLVRRLFLILAFVISFLSYYCHRPFPWHFLSIANMTNRIHPVQLQTYGVGFTPRRTVR